MLSREEKLLRIEHNFRKYNKFLYHLSLSILRDKEDAEEMVQETWVRACYYIDSYDESKGASYKGWLGTICKRLCITEFNRRKVRHYTQHFQYIDEMGTKPSFDKTDQLAMFNEADEKVRHVLKDKPQEMDTFEKLLDGYSVKKLSEYFGGSRSKYNRRVMNLRKTIKMHLTKNLEIIKEDNYHV